MEHFVYIIYSDGLDKYYVGKTSDVERRLAFHNSEMNQIWTRRGKPWKLMKAIPFESSTLASKAELFIKKQKSRQFIERIIEQGWKA